MNKFIITNWYIYDLNFNIYNYLKNKYKKNFKKENKEKIINRISKDYKLIIK